MERLFFEYFVRAGLLVGGTALVLHITRVKAAAEKHRVWAGVLLLMLALPIWTAWGPKAPLRLLPPPTHFTANSSFKPVGPLPAVTPSSRILSNGQAALILVYLLGVCSLLFRLGVGTVRAHRLVRDAVIHENVRTSTLCAAPVTVGFFHPVIILPEGWRDWRHTQLEAVLIHEGEHVRRRDALVQWIALLNRALFWFHPAVWWLERHLSGLAEEACDNLVLARGCNPREYAECLIDIARSVGRSGSRLTLAGMAMPGILLPQRVRRIMEGAQAVRVSRSRMTCVAVLCAITCTAFAAGTLEHMQQNSPEQDTEIPRLRRVVPPAALSGLGFALGDLKIEGNVDGSNAVRERILREWKDQESGDPKNLAEVVAVSLRRDFQERGYFTVMVQDPVAQLLGQFDGKERVLVSVSITEGAQFRLGTLISRSATPGRELSIPATTLRQQFHIGTGELFKPSEFRAGIDRMKQLYDKRGFPDTKLEPETHIDNTSHRVDVILHITEEPNQP